MNIKETNNWRKVRARLFKMVSVGVIDDPINQGYDVISTGALIINLAVSVMATFDNLNAMYGDFFVVGDAGTDSQCPLSETGINNALGTRVARFGLFNQMYHVCHDYLETYSLRMTAWKT